MMHCVGMQCVRMSCTIAMYCMHVTKRNSLLSLGTLLGCIGGERDN